MVTVPFGGISTESMTFPDGSFTVMLCDEPPVLVIVRVTVPVAATATVFGSKKKLPAFMISAACPGVICALVAGAAAPPDSTSASRAERDSTRIVVGFKVSSLRGSPRGMTTLTRRHSKEITSANPAASASARR